MSLSRITKAEIDEWGSASGVFRGFEFTASKAKGGGYEAELLVMWAPDGEHDGLVHCGSCWGSTIAELKSEISRHCREFVDENNLTAGQIAKIALKHDFSGRFEEFEKKFLLKSS